MMTKGPCICGKSHIFEEKPYISERAIYFHVFGSWVTPLLLLSRCCLQWVRQTVPPLSFVSYAPYQTATHISLTKCIHTHDMHPAIMCGKKKFSATQHTKRPHTFGIFHHDRRDYFLEAPSHTVLLEWVIFPPYVFIYICIFHILFHHDRRDYFLEAPSHTVLLEWVIFPPYPHMFPFVNIFPTFFANTIG